METISLQDYNIYVSEDWVNLKQLLANGNYSSITVIVDEHTHEHCWPLVRDVLDREVVQIIEIPSGEQHKNIETCQHIWSSMMKANIGRRGVVINLGGGVIGDMGGFCAGTFKRGIDFIQIPTTLLSQVDASIGGKLGIDFQQIKNSIGLFRNPIAVFINPIFFKTLPERELRSGFAEVIKHSLIADTAQWEQLSAIESLAEVDWPSLIIPSLKIKQRIVEKDPHEKGIRKALNFGHTVGHAIEGVALETDFPLLHGEAIAVGMICEAYLSTVRLGLPKSALSAITGFILKLYGHNRLVTSDFETYIELMRNDKKNENAEINFSLISNIGEVAVNQTCSLDTIIKSLNYYNEQAPKNVLP